jgi:O-antigen/teichoic acid export membrane protein
VTPILTNLIARLNQLSGLRRSPPSAADADSGQHPLPTTSEAGTSNPIGHNERKGMLRAVLARVGRGGESQSTMSRLRWTMGASLLNLLTSLATGVIVARTLGPNGRGILTAVMLYGLLLPNLGGLGIADALVYRSGRTQAGVIKSPALATAIGIGVVQSLILILAGWAILPFLLRMQSRTTVSLALTFLAMIPLVFLSLYPQAVLQGRLRLIEFNLARTCAGVIYAVALFVLWRLGSMSVELALAAFLASAGVSCIVGVAAAAEYSSRHATVGMARELLSYGLRSHAGNLAVTVAAQLDILLLAALVPPRELGYYVVATSAAIAGSLIPAAVSLVLFPTFATQPTDAAPRALARFLLWGFAGALVLFPTLMLIVPVALPLVYGPPFTAAAHLSLILVPGYLLRGAGQMLSAILRGSGSPMRASGGQIVGLVVLGTLVPIGISMRGAEGAAIAVTLSAAAAFVWLLVTALRHGQLSPRLALIVWRSDLTRLRLAIQPCALLVRR